MRLNAWEPLEPLGKVHPNDKICHAIAVNGKIYALARKWLFTEVFCYDILANEWTQCGCDELDTNSWQDTVLLKAKSNCFYAVGRNGRVHLYDTDEERWNAVHFCHSSFRLQFSHYNFNYNSFFRLDE